MKINQLLTLSLLLVLSIACKKTKKEKHFKHDKKGKIEIALTPVDFPNLNIPGFEFPQDSLTLNRWIHKQQNDSIYLHGWGIWTGLMEKTALKVEGMTSDLRVFETWLTPEEMIAKINKNPLKRSNRANLKKPNQFTHFKGEQTLNDSIHESVAYSPAAANFAIKNKLFKAQTLYEIAKKKKEIPFFPNDAMTIKPVFKLLPVSSGETKFNISTWHGTIDKLKAYPEQDWATFVTVDVKNEQPSRNDVYTLDDFIHYKLNAEDIEYFKKEFTENSSNPFEAEVGDIAILVGMHVTTREITNWTWQTFWWTPDADNPPFPSKKEIANQRPAALKGAARHYAMSVAYYMVDPNEPYTGENIKGKPLYAFNPYLEAGFGPDVFKPTNTSYVIDKTTNKRIDTYAGVRTNCMSCHRMASVDPKKLVSVANSGSQRKDTLNNSSAQYVGASYVSADNPIFKNQLKLDFAWSIQGNVDYTGFKEYLDNIDKSTK